MSDTHPTSASSFTLDGTLDRFEGKFAVLRTIDNQELHWPIAQLPPGLEQGNAVQLVLSTAATQAGEREALAKTILNQILKKPSSSP